MVSTSSFLSLELRADNVAEFDAKKADILKADWNEADRPVNVAGILTQHFWKAPESFVPAEEAEAEDPVDPVDPEDPVDPVDPVDPEEPVEP